MFDHASGRLWAPFVVPKRWASQQELNTQQKEKKLATSSAGGACAAGKDTKAKDEMQVVNTFAKNAFDEVWTYLQPFRGHDLAHIRIFTLGDDDEMRFTEKGVAINVRDLPKLAEAVAALIAAVEARKS
jgi:hypothetical protein